MITHYTAGMYSLRLCNKDASRHFLNTPTVPDRAALTLNLNEMSRCGGKDVSDGTLSHSESGVLSFLQHIPTTTTTIIMYIQANSVCSFSCCCCIPPQQQVQKF